MSASTKWAVVCPNFSGDLGDGAKIWLDGLATQEEARDEKKIADDECTSEACSRMPRRHKVVDESTLRVDVRNGDDRKRDPRKRKASLDRARENERRKRNKGINACTACGEIGHDKRWHEKMRSRVTEAA